MTNPTTSSSLWRNRDFTLVLGGGVVNNIGDWMLEVALPVYIYLETGSGKATAAVYVIELIASVAFGAIGGSLVDRWNLRRTLIATNVLQAITLLPLLWVTSDRIWPAFLVAGAQALIQQVNDPASFAVVPRLVPDEQLVPANAAASSGASIARLIGSPLGGILVATGGLTAVVVADAATFAIGGISAWLISNQLDSVVDATGDETGDVGGGEPEGGPGAAADSSVRAGLRELRQHSALAAVVAIQSLARVSFAAFPVLFIVFVADELAGGGTEVGVIRGMAAFGGIVAAVLVGRFAAKRHPARLMAGGYVLFALVGLLFVNAPEVTTAFWVYLVLFGLTGFPNVVSQVGAQTVSQQLCPPSMLGRLGGVMSATGAVGAGIGAIGAGLLIDVVPVRVLFNTQTLNLGLCGVLAYLLVVKRVTPPSTGDTVSR